MRKAIASIIIIAFVGLLTTTMLVIFSDTSFASQYIHSQALQYPYFVAY